jgi:hypothetical protein
MGWFDVIRKISVLKGDLQGTPPVTPQIDRI